MGERDYSDTVMKTLFRSVREPVLLPGLPGRTDAPRENRDPRQIGCQFWRSGKL